LDKEIGAIALDRIQRPKQVRIEGAYNSSKFGNDANQSGISPVRLLLSKCLRSPKGQQMVDMYAWTMSFGNEKSFNEYPPSSESFRNQTV